MKDGKKIGGRFPLNLPPDVDAKIRDIARGNEVQFPSKINDVIVQLIREALAARQARNAKKEDSSGNWLPSPMAA